MRYRYAHWWLAALLPLILLAFWPGYFSQIGSSTLARHVHGVSGTLWIGLAALQSWSIASRRRALHRALGRALFVVVPLFVAGGTLALVAMSQAATAQSDPFSTAFGARLVPADLSSEMIMPLLVRDALVHRRDPNRHAASMLATVLLVLPPVLARLCPLIPGFPPGFVAAVTAAQLVAATIAIALWLGDRRGGFAFIVVAIVMVTQLAMFAIYPGKEVAHILAAAPPLALASAAALTTFLVLWIAWRPLRPLARAAPSV